jgi:hypothetical protein
LYAPQHVPPRAVMGPPDVGNNSDLPSNQFDR